MSDKAAGYGRKIDFGPRLHLIVRETEVAARQAAKDLMSRLDDDLGKDICERAQDAKSLGVARQSALRTAADDEGYAEEHLRTGIGRVRSGGGAALVGNPDQI